MIEVDAEKVGDETTFGQVLRLVVAGQAAEGPAREDSPTAWRGTSCRSSSSSRATLC